MRVRCRVTGRVVVRAADWSLSVGSAALSAADDVLQIDVYTFLVIAVFEIVVEIVIVI